MMETQGYSIRTCVLSDIGTDKIGKFLVGAVTVNGGNHGAPVQTASTAGGSVFPLSLLMCSLRAPNVECNCSKWLIKFPNIN